MARRVSSESGGNGAGIRAVRAGPDPPGVAPAAGLHQDHRNGGTAAVHAAEERGQAEAALAFAASIVESADDAIVGMTLYGMITSWNAGAERLYGYTAREVFGRGPVGITIPEAELLKILKRVGRGERVNHYETVRVNKNKRRINVSVTVSPIRDAEGKIVGASSIARDITPRREAEAATPHPDTVRYVASLAAAAAHEINNPLAVVMGYAQLLADKVDAHGRGQIDEILEALSRIQEIVRRMKRVTRIELSEEAPHLPEMLDLKRSSEPGLPLHSQAPGVVSMASDRR
jgi:PAS domain S-box-containing protein